MSGTKSAALIDATDAEKLVLERRRAGLGQPAMALLRGVGMRLYRRWEFGAEPMPPRAADHVRSVVPTDAEACFLLRRREGWSRAGMARRIGTSETWITQMERGAAPAHRLIAYWSARETRR